MKFLKYLFLSACVLTLILLFNMKEKGGKNTIAFYNVENLFDTINDPKVNDEEFLPHGKNHWNSKRYFTKLENLSEVIAELGDADGPEILGLAEVENSRVLKDLTMTAALKKMNYRIIHQDCEDRRGIDVALLYKEKFLKPLEVKAFPIPDSEDKNYRTRDILYVKGMVQKDTLHLFVIHWPSRLGGKEQSEKHRIHAARSLKSVLDSICQLSKSDNILVMGDFNDEPVDKSIKVLSNRNEECSLLNPFEDLDRQKLGTIKFKRNWELFDQILLSTSLSNENGIEYKENSADIYDPLWMHYKEDERNGPYRSFVGNKYSGGYSDHFPVYIQLK